MEAKKIYENNLDMGANFVRVKVGEELRGREAGREAETGREIQARRIIREGDGMCKKGNTT